MATTSPSTGSAGSIPAIASTAAAKTERPPLQHMDTSGRTVTSNPPLYAYSPDLEKGESQNGTLVLRKPPPNSEDLVKEVDKLQGYRGRNNDGNGGVKPVHGQSQDNYRWSFTDPPDNTNVVVDEEMKKTTLGKIYAYIMTKSIVTRWLFLIMPLLAILWIPGILSVTAFPNAEVWGVRLIWWSIWLTILWGGLWAALATARIIPIIIRATVGAIAISTRRYIDEMRRVFRYLAFFIWTLATWVSYQPLINIHRNPSIGVDSAQALTVIGKVLFGIFLSSAILLFEKFCISFIAWKFHERSYAERIANHAAHVNILVVLYSRSSELPPELDHPAAEDLFQHPWEFTQKQLFSQVGNSIKVATTVTATLFGNLVSEILGTSVLQPNSPQAIVKTALEERKKMKQLAKRIFFSFVKGSDHLVLQDIAKFFPSPEKALDAFELFDKDGNGDVTLQEVYVACLTIYDEQRALQKSLQCTDSAVRRLDQIFISLYVVIAAVVVAVVLDSQVSTLITGAGALVLGLSWLIGGSLQEVLTSIIFIFIKHPFDMNDRVVINNETYIVHDIMLLSTTFLDSNSTLIQAPNSQLSTLFIQNIRRSPPMSETFVFDVNYATTSEDLRKLGEKMLAFVKAEARDFLPGFEVTVKDFPGQTKMTLSADIKFKSNIQLGDLRAKRRNKWICALKSIMAELKIYGPAGDPNAPPGVNRYTKVPYDEIKQQEEKEREKKESAVLEERQKLSGEERQLGDKNTVLMGSDVFGSSSGQQVTSTPQRGLSQASGSPQRAVGLAAVFEMEQTGS